jgi:DNA-binding NtrC family response regulator
MALNNILAVSRQSYLQKIAGQFASTVLVADEPAEAFTLARSSDCDLALFDDVFTPAQIEHFIQTTDNYNIDIPVIILSGRQKQKSMAQKYQSAGALDYLCSKNEMDKLHEHLNAPSNSPDKSKTSNEQSKYFLDELSETTNLAGKSEAMQQTLEMTRLVASSQCNPVLVVGETGTGKEVIARTIHSIRCPKEPFVAINCAALTANLLESELFGHVKGSFTGAEKEKTGLLELAGKGILFLDEISEMPLDLQAKLLRILQEKNFRKVGGTTTITCHATVIASSNRNLLKEVNERKFRQDLYYRLNVCPIKLLPLRHKQRKQDIRLLSEYFLGNSKVWPDKSKNIKSLTSLAIDALEKHDWPGNVRELKNIIDRAIMLEKTDKIGLNSIVLDKIDENEPINQTSNNKVNDYSLAAAEKELINRALKETGWQKTKAATMLGITRATLYAKVKQYNISEATNKNRNKTSSPTQPIPATVG